MFEMAANYA